MYVLHLLNTIVRRTVQYKNTPKNHGLSPNLVTSVSSSVLAAWRILCTAFHASVHSACIEFGMTYTVWIPSGMLAHWSTVRWSIMSHFHTLGHLGSVALSSGLPEIASVSASSHHPPCTLPPSFRPVAVSTAFLLTSSLLSSPPLPPLGFPCSPASTLVCVVPAPAIPGT
jgi:hypothetical protein